MHWEYAIVFALGMCATLVVGLVTGRVLIVFQKGE
jgi:hypothetical protein